MTAAARRLATQGAAASCRLQARSWLPAAPCRCSTAMAACRCDMRAPCNPALQAWRSRLAAAAAPCPPPRGRALHLRPCVQQEAQPPADQQQQQQGRAGGAPINKEVISKQMDGRLYDYLVQARRAPFAGRDLLEWAVASWWTLWSGNGQHSRHLPPVRCNGSCSCCSTPAGRPPARHAVETQPRRPIPPLPAAHARTCGAGGAASGHRGTVPHWRPYADITRARSLHGLAGAGAAGEAAAVCGMCTCGPMLRGRACTWRLAPPAPLRSGCLLGIAPLLQCEQTLGAKRIIEVGVFTGYSR